MPIFTAPARSANLPELEAKIIAVLRELVEARVASRGAWDSSTKLTNLGLDSMKKVALAFRIEELFQLDLSSFQEKLWEIETIGDVSALVARALEAP